MPTVLAKAMGKSGLLFPEWRLRPERQKTVLIASRQFMIISILTVE
jgi:hypothetical protein